MIFRCTVWNRRVIVLIITNVTALFFGPDVVAGQRLELTYDYLGRADSMGVFHLPIPPQTSGQNIESFHSSWNGSETTNAAQPAQRWLSGNVPGGGRLHWRVRIVGTFLRGGGSSASPPAPGGFEEASSALDWDSGAFQDWLDRHDLRRHPAESASGCARRIYDYLVGHGDYTYPPSGGWTASGAARRLRTDCGGFSLVFVAACRANHIPARLLVGQWLKTSGDGNSVVDRQAHVTAEFYDPATGWRPVDVSSGLTRVGGSGDYFGRLPGYFFTWHFDTDYEFDVPPGANGHVQWVQNPSPFFGDNSGEHGSHHWSIEPR